MMNLIKFCQINWRLKFVDNFFKKNLVIFLVLTTPTADSWRIVKMLVKRMNHFGTKALSSTKKLLSIRPSDLLPNAQ